MIKKLHKNIKFFRRYWCAIAPKPLVSAKPEIKKVDEGAQQIISKGQTMSPFKGLFIFTLKLFIFLVLANVIIVKPLSNAISKGLEGFDNNPLVKIISLDFISNPLTFIRMSEYYLEKNDLKKARLYLQYAETIKSRYPYPMEINTQLIDLREKIRTNAK
jgi:hypothetical protein